MAWPKSDRQQAGGKRGGDNCHDRSERRQRGNATDVQLPEVQERRTRPSRATSRALSRTWARFPAMSRKKAPRKVSRWAAGLYPYRHRPENGGNGGNADRRALRGGAGWLPSSAEMGAPGNCVIFGHRMKKYGRHFNRLDELEAGDEINLSAGDGDVYT